MGKKNKKGSALLWGIGIATAYGILKSSGIINRTLYRKEHETVSRYIESKHPGGTFSDIKKTDNGYFTVITTVDNRKIALFFIETDDGNYIFSETSAEK